MKLSLNWLSDYVRHGLPAEAVADLLTMSGLEVEGAERLGPTFDGVVVGGVLEARPHPEADRLTLCRVDLGTAHATGEPVQIVCGAPNVAAGQKVAVATVGTTLDLPSRSDPAVREPVTLRRAKIRGEVSNGMICAEDELGLGDSHAGILVLDADAPIGQPFADYLAAHGQMTGDVVLDVNITPNRPDATSHAGVARDVAALTGEALRLPEVTLPETSGAAAGAFSVEIQDAEGCPRYVGLLVRNVTVGPSPEWLRARLEAVGVRPINNVVDVTNYALHELGQPLHAFDLDRLEGKKIVVRRSRPGEALTTLDDKERALPEGTLLICDAEKPVAVAGVMGGANSEVTSATTSVLIESAYFDPVSVRRAARALGLATDASYRFERGVDPTGQPRAAARAAALMAEVAGGTVVPGMVDMNPCPYEPRTVTLRPSRLRRVLGADVPEEDAVRLLRAIGFEVEAEAGRALDAFAEVVMRSESLRAAVGEAREAGLRCVVPPWRPDVTREADVIEEVARLWGFDRIPDPATATVPLEPTPQDPLARRLDALRARLVGLGCREAYTNSLVPRATAEQFAALTGTGAGVVQTLNPISQEMAALRPSLLPGLLAVAAYNQARGAEAVRLFEVGHVYARAAPLPAQAGSAQAGSADAQVSGYHEHTALAVVLSGPAAAAGWDQPARASDFFDLKGVLFHALGALDGPPLDETTQTEPDALFAYRLHLDADGQRLGVLGRVSDAVAALYDLRAPVYVAEVNAELAAALDRRTGPVRYRPVSRFPVVQRDLAVVVAESERVGPMLRTAEHAGRPLVQDVRVFDLFRGETLGDGLKSVALALRLGADRTLTDEEVERQVRRVAAALERQHGARLRG